MSYSVVNSTFYYTYKNSSLFHIHLDKEQKMLQITDLYKS